MQDQGNNQHAAAGIQLLCLDCDGVLTDGTILIDSDGRESKRFHVMDGIGIRAWLSQGGMLAVITARNSPALRARMEELGVEVVIEDAKDKGAALASVMDRFEVTSEQVAFLGDDLADLPALARCGFPMTPANGSADVKEHAAWIGTRNGGDGAVREAIEFLLRARGSWSDVLASFLGAGGRV